MSTTECSCTTLMDHEEFRLYEDDKRDKNWKRWGPYLSERQWATVREDYSPNGDAWNYLSHERSRSQAYRWGEDGILGITDRQCRLCFAITMWNGKDPILKERLFGVTGNEGNHGEDVKELYYYLDSTPTHSYMKGLYKYPIDEYPYAKLVQENKHRSRHEPEFELLDTGLFSQDRYFDVFAEYAKASDNDILIKITLQNMSKDTAEFHLLPTLFFRNTWEWGCNHEGCTMKPLIRKRKPSDKFVLTRHDVLEQFCFYVDEEPTEWLWTDNETNNQTCYGIPNEDYNHKKDGFHLYLTKGQKDALCPGDRGTKMAPHYNMSLAAGETRSFRFRLTVVENMELPFDDFDEVFSQRICECDHFWNKIIPATLTAEEKMVARQAAAGLLWTKQFYHYIIKDWLEGDPDMPPPPDQRLNGRNVDWPHLFNRDVISMPDKWEYPWFATWDLAFHMVPFSYFDPYFAKDQLILFLREWYMHPNGALPAYEYDFNSVNPPVHAWACWKVYKFSGKSDRLFLRRVFQKLLMNFTWWVNRKDISGKNIFSGGFLGLDNISIFDRSEVHDLEQADATSWMAFFCSSMLNIAIELAQYDPAMEDIASKFFEHFVAIIDAINHFGGSGLWNEEDGFYYDQMKLNGTERVPLKIRSMVGLIPICAVNILFAEHINKLKGFKHRLEWFLKNKPSLSKHVTEENGNYLLSLVNRNKLKRILQYMLSEDEFLSEFGIRSLSKYHKDHPYRLHDKGKDLEVSYLPGESNTGMFGGNSNWRGPIWFPVNTLIIESLLRFHRFYGDSFTTEFPTGSGNMMNLQQIANELQVRNINIFSKKPDGSRPCHGTDAEYASKSTWEDLVLFYEYFHGDSGKGLGASHQTGWTGLVFHQIQSVGRYLKSHPKKV